MIKCRKCGTKMNKVYDGKYKCPKCNNIRYIDNEDLGYDITVKTVKIGDINNEKF